MLLGMHPSDLLIKSLGGNAHGSWAPWVHAGGFPQATSVPPVTQCVSFLGYVLDYYSL